MYIKKIVINTIRIFINIIVFGLLVSAGYAQGVNLNITKQGLTKIKIAVDSNLSSGLEKILIQDLELSDYFQPVPTGEEFLLRCRQTGSLTIEGRLYNAKSKQMLLGKRFSGAQNQGPKLVHALADSIIKRMTGEKGIAQAKLAFEYKGRIYISDYNGANPKAVIKDRCLNLFPNWSPNGDKLVYTSYLYGYPQVFIYNLKTGKRRRICGYPGLNTSAAFSPDGKYLAVTLSKDGNPDIYIIDVNKRHMRRITKNRSVDTSACFSPKGKYLAFVSNRSGSPQIYIVNSLGGITKRLTYKGAYNTNPSWSPKGNFIAYNSIINGQFQICAINIDTGNKIQITKGKGNHENPCFALDGRHIVFSLSKGYNTSIYIIDMFYKNPHRLTMQKGVFRHPRITR